MPKVSVIIPTYNAGKFVREAVDSVLNQAYEDYEIIVVDGGSVDNTRELLSSYGEKIRFIRQTDRGVAAARNVGILNSKGEYVAFLDADDQWLSQKLKLQVKYLDEHPAVGLVFSDAWCITGGEPLPSDFHFVKRTSQISKPFSGKVFDKLFVRNFIPCLSVLVRRTCLDKVGLFDTDLSLAEDYDLWLRVARITSVHYIDQPLAIYRKHVDSLSHNIESAEKEIESIILLKKKMIDFDPSLRAKLSHQTMETAYYHYYIDLGIIQFKKGERRKARKNFRQYIQLSLSNPRVYFLVLITVIPFRRRAVQELSANKFLSVVSRALKTL